MKKMKKKWITVYGLLLLLGGMPLYAAENTNEVQSESAERTAEEENIEKLKQLALELSGKDEKIENAEASYYIDKDEPEVCEITVSYTCVNEEGENSYKRDFYSVFLENGKGILRKKNDVYTGTKERYNVDLIAQEMSRPEEWDFEKMACAFL